VGCGWYTRAYGRLFRHAIYCTLDVDPAKSRWGAERHVCASLASIRSHFEDGALDLVVCNGVFGWGLNERTEVEAAFRGCHACLRPGGVLLLGWNDVPARRPFPIEQCESLHLFRPYRFAPLDGYCHRTATRNRHTYNFYEK
jgi:SAM-dependent methyltransferase